MHVAEHAGLIPIGQAARLLMISEERIRQLVKQGFIPKPEKRGFVQLVGAVQGYLRYLKDDERRSAKSAADSREVRGKTLGIVGYGNIGAQVSVLAEAFEFELEVWIAMHENLKGHRRMRLMFDHLVAGFQAFLAEGRGAGLRAQMVLLAVAVTLFLPALEAGTHRMRHRDMRHAAAAEDRAFAAHGAVQELIDRIMREADELIQVRLRQFAEA